VGLMFEVSNIKCILSSVSQVKDVMSTLTWGVYVVSILLLVMLSFLFFPKGYVFSDAPHKAVDSKTLCSLINLKIGSNQILTIERQRVTNDV
jgi:hypothetical protein